MGKRVIALTLVMLLAGCTRVIEAQQAQPEPAVAPITAGQVGELLSPEVQDLDGNLFASVTPEDCSGIAREVDPPFISDHSPAATDGGHWVDDSTGMSVQIEEMTGVFRSDFDSAAAIADAQAVIDSCRGNPFTITAMDGQAFEYTLDPAVDSGKPEILLWSFTGEGWGCDFGYVAAHNAAVEISACSYVNGYDMLALATAALERIEALANTTL